MKFIRVTLVGGLLFLAPLVIVAVILEKALGFVHKLVAPLAAKLPIESVIGVRLSMVIAALVLIFVCFAAGMFARTALARRIITWLEEKMLSNLPGYSFLKSIGEDMLGAESTAPRQVVLAHLDDAWQLGFLIERADDGLIAIFVPDAPNPRAGSVIFMRPENVRLLENVSPASVQKCLKRLGGGANELLGKQSIS